MVTATWLLCPENERQRSINDFWPRIIEVVEAVRQH